MKPKVTTRSAVYGMLLTVPVIGFVILYNLYVKDLLAAFLNPLGFIYVGGAFGYAAAESDIKKWRTILYAIGLAVVWIAGGTMFCVTQSAYWISTPIAAFVAGNWLGTKMSLNSD